MKLKDLNIDYVKKYNSLTKQEIYECYNHLYNQLINKIRINNLDDILFVAKSPMDIDYIAVVQEIYSDKNVFMTGFEHKIFNNKFFYKKIIDYTMDYEFFNFNYQPKYNRVQWKLDRKNKKQIKYIILPCKFIQNIENEFLACVPNKKMFKFLSSFQDVKFIGIGFDISMVNQKIESSQKILLSDIVIISTSVKKEKI